MNKHKARYSIIKFLFNFPIDKINKIERIIGAQMRSYLTDLLNTFNIEQAKIKLLSSKSELCSEIYLLGEKGVFDTSFIDISKIQSDFAIYNSTYIFKIEGINHSDNRKVLLGLFILKRKYKLRISEINVLIYAASVLGDYLNKKIAITYESDYKEILDKLQTYNYNDKKSGTIIFNHLHYANRALNASFGFFGIVDKNKLSIIYALKQNNKRQFINPRHSKYHFEDDIITNLNRSNFIYVERNSKLSSVLSTIYKDIHSEYSFLLSFTRINSELISVWILAYSPHDYFDINKSEIHFRLNENNTLKFIQHIYQRTTNKMIVNPIFNSRDTKSQKKIFVLMPFTLEWSDRIWKKIIKPTIEGIGVPVNRADDFYGNDLMEDIWTEILTSDIIIADITNRNPNVFYELGIAHTIGKKVILLTQDVKDIPVDLNRFRHIVYKDNFDGYEILKDQLVATIKSILDEK